MVEIKGKLSSLFGRTNMDIELTEELLASMINCPITKDSICIGVIKGVNKNKDEWSGFLFDTVAAEISEDKKYCQSINFINLLNL